MRGFCRTRARIPARHSFRRADVVSIPDRVITDAFAPELARLGLESGRSYTWQGHGRPRTGETYAPQVRADCRQALVRVPPGRRRRASDQSRSGVDSSTSISGADSVLANKITMLLPGLQADGTMIPSRRANTAAAPTA